jgi:hypothetical protein
MSFRFRVMRGLLLNELLERYNPAFLGDELAESKMRATRDCGFCSQPLARLLQNVGTGRGHLDNFAPSVLKFNARQSTRT